ncbi:AMP-binding protein [Thalassotalea mangrovi]|uniref:Long-chain-fatty-acid--CoA ligase n=1 Tax=Thalassotalea mangrovi TaxID=2572245 RepID=A0A4U1B6Y5_9GAMM|nr:AMP-binding protein [Thalassotalea mangrovi]TKB46318.1 long-chain fatty acid--CoA ligase [Thalassotalea mangrovi]
MLERLNDFQNLNEYLQHAMERYQDLPAYTCLGQTLTFAEVDEKANQLAAYYQSIGLKAGDRIVIQLPNLIQYPIAMYAALKAGLVIVNTNPLYTPAEMLHQFNDSGAVAIVILSDLYPKLAQIKSQTGIKHVITSNAGDLLTGSKDKPDAEAVSFNDALESGAQRTVIESNAGIDDLAVLQYTGGTTGVSKGAQLTHKNIIANALQSAERLGDSCREGDGIFICPLPLYHIYAFTVNMVLLASIGNHNVLIPNPRDLDAFIGAIKAFKFNGFAGLNTLFVGLCSKPEFRALDFSEFRVTLSGGTALTHTAADTWQSVTGCTISEGYGLSETAPVVCLNQPGHEQIGTVGTPLVGTEVQLWSDDDQPVADGESGQVVVKGPQVMTGYWNMPDETAQCLTANGYFKTGDIGIRLPDGKIQIVDRLKDLIIVSGFNVYPNEVEDALVKHPAVMEAAVIGEPCEHSGERVHAYVTLREQADNSEIIAHCRQTLTAYKVPKAITVMDELPKSAVGKILRRSLRNVG